MKIIEIPYSPVNLFLFVGEKDREQFNSKVRSKYPDWKNDENSDGMFFENHVFLEDIKTKEVLIHEVFHFLEWLFKYMEIEEEAEFKACIASNVLCEVLKK